MAYGNFARLKQKERDLISQNPNAARPRFRLAQVEEASGQWLEALRLYEEALAKATPQDTLAGEPLKPIAAEHRFKLLLRLGKQASGDGFPKKAIGHFEDAVNASTNPAPARRL